MLSWDFSIETNAEINIYLRKKSRVIDSALDIRYYPKSSETEERNCTEIDSKDSHGRFHQSRSHGEGEPLSDRSRGIYYNRSRVDEQSEVQLFRRGLESTNDCIVVVSYTLPSSKRVRSVRFPLFSSFLLFVPLIPSIFVHHRNLFLHRK